MQLGARQLEWASSRGWSQGVYGQVKTGANPSAGSVLDVSLKVSIVFPLTLGISVLVEPGRAG